MTKPEDIKDKNYKDNAITYPSALAENTRPGLILLFVYASRLMTIAILLDWIQIQLSQDLLLYT